MKPSKLLTAFMPAAVAAVASRELAQGSTKTVVTAVATNTHTSIVFVTANAGQTLNTCLASVCGPDISTDSIVSTISLTGFTTSTVTQVFTPPDATITITRAVATPTLTPCDLRSQSTITVTVTEAGTPSITNPTFIEPTAKTSKSESLASLPHSGLSTTTLTDAQQAPPYPNGTIVNFTGKPPDGPTGYPPLHGDVLGAVPDAPIHAATAVSSNKYSVDTIGGSIAVSGGGLKKSVARMIRPPRLLTLFAKLLSIHSLTRPLFVNAMVAKSETQSHQKARSLGQGDALHENHAFRRWIVINTPVSTDSFESQSNVSVIISTLLQGISRVSSESLAASTDEAISAPAPLVSPLLQKPNDLTPAPNHFSTVPPDTVTLSITPIGSPMTSPRKESSSSEGHSSSLTNGQSLTIVATVTTVDESVTITNTVITTDSISNTVNVTNTVETHTTRTRTVSETLSTATGETASAGAHAIRVLNALAVTILFLMLVLNTIGAT